MKKDQSMKEIEQLLEMAPEINDTRTKDEIFARLKKDGIFEEGKQTEPTYQEPVLKRQSGNRLVTVVVAAIGFITLGGISGFLLTQNNSIDETSSGADMVSMEDTMVPEIVGERSIQPYNSESSEIGTAAFMESYIPESTLVWEDELAWAQQLQLGLVTEQLDVVQASVLIDQNRIINDFGSPSETYLSYYNH